MIFNRSGKNKDGNNGNGAAPQGGAQNGYTQGAGVPGTYFGSNSANGYGQAAGNGYGQAGVNSAYPGAAGAASYGQAGANSAYGTAGGNAAAPYGQAGMNNAYGANAGSGAYGAAGMGGYGYGNAGTGANGAYGTAGTGMNGAYGTGANGAYGTAGTGANGVYGAAGTGANNAYGTGTYAGGQGYAQPGAAPYGTGGFTGYAPQNGYGTAGTGANGAYGNGMYTPGGMAGNTGYAPGYGQNAQGGYAPQGAGSRAGTGYAPQGGGYPAGYGQTPYGGNPQQAQGYPQMGRGRQNVPQGTAGQIPLNGGGYVPPPMPRAKGSYRMNDLQLILISAVLAALFAVGIAMKISALLWVFAVLAIGMTVLFWAVPMIASNKRLCFTVVAVALAAVAILQAAGLLQPGTAGGGGASATAVPAGSAGTPVPAGSQVVIDPKTGEVVATVAVGEEAQSATPTPVPDDNAAADRLESFFYFWSVNKYDDMVNMCAPSWLTGLENPKNVLFGLLANRTPLDYTVEKISGTPNDSSRTVTVVSTMDRNNGKEPVKYRLGVLMVHEADQWYVDPQSLKTYEQAETPDPATLPTETPSPTPPTPANTVLYYNPNGGTKYHLDPNCKSTHAKFLPFKGHFTYSQVNEDAYKDLEPCNVCAAPLRP